METNRLLHYLNFHILLVYVLAIAELSVLACTDTDVFQRNAVDGHFGDAVEIHGTARTRTRQVFDVDVAEARSGFVDGHGRHFCGNYLAAFEHFDRDLLRNTN